MSTYNKVLVCCTVVIIYSSCVTAFFLNWGSSSERKSSYTPVPIQQPTYQRRHLHAPYAVDLTTNDNAPPAVAQTPASIPTVPIQVPLQATFLPSNIHNVQLVPCLCPIAEDYEYDPQTDTVVITQKPNNNKT